MINQLREFCKYINNKKNPLKIVKILKNRKKKKKIFEKFLIKIGHKKISRQEQKYNLI